MDWYQKLSSYFPEHEMKSKTHLEDLLNHKDEYNKIETENYVVLYAEFSDFLFIDYLLVFKSDRGQGIGSQVLSEFKKKQKSILLEVEPRDPDDPDTIKRFRFYDKNGFGYADQIEYIFIDEQGNSFPMKLFYWPPYELSQRDIMERMQRIINEIHNFRSETKDGQLTANPERVLRFKELSYLH